MSKLRSEAKEYVPTHSPGTKMVSPSGQTVAITSYDAYIPKSAADKMGYVEMGKTTKEEEKSMMETAKKYRAGRKRKNRKTVKKSRKVRRRKH